MDRIRIGTITLHEHTRAVKDNYECAAWRTVFEIPPGTYDLYGYFNWAGSLHQLSWDVHAPVVDDHKPSMFAGSPIGGRSDWDTGRVLPAPLPKGAFELAQLNPHVVQLPKPKYAHQLRLVSNRA